jgi:uncharacterized repeat protein (TIGR03803 family)
MTRPTLAAMCVVTVFGWLPAQAQTYKVLHAFTGPDGSQPRAALIADPAGNLFGTASAGGSFDNGTVFKLSKTGLTVLYQFHPPPDGLTPFSPLLRDSAGNLYGTTANGGSEEEGAIFKLDSIGKETVLFGFRRSADGRFPLSGLIQDQAGNLYGTTAEGGEYNPGGGVVFELGKAGFTVLYSFPSGGGVLAPT